MDKPDSRWSHLLKRFHSKRSMSLLAVVTIVLAIPFTVSLVKTFTDLRQRAETGIANPPADTTTNISYPWNSQKSGKRSLPVVPVSTKAFLARVPFSSPACSKRTSGDADCNNVIDQGDLSYWQIDYIGKTTKFADFNRDGKVTLADYNIWRLHADVSPTPAVQRVVENMGLGKILSFIPWNKLSINSFHVLAVDDGSGTVTNSSVTNNNNGTSTVTNVYADNSYSVQNVSVDTNTANAAYYTGTGDLLASVNNFLQDVATTVTQIGNTTVTVSHDTSGSVVQTMQDSNGLFMASQVWADQTSYEQNAAPQAATIPTTDGYTTLTVQPNNTSIVIKRDANGTVIEKMTVDVNGTVTVENYKTNMIVSSNKALHLTILSLSNNLGGKTSYTIYYDHMTSITQTDNKGNTYVETVVQDGNNPSNYKWKLVTTDANGKSTERMVDDPMWSILSQAPSPEEIMLVFRQYRNSLTANTSFSDAFQTANDLTRSADSFVAVQNLTATSSAVLGASIGPVKQSTKAVLAAAVGIKQDGPSTTNPTTGATTTQYSYVNAAGGSVQVNGASGVNVTVGGNVGPNGDRQSASIQPVDRSTGQPVGPSVDLPEKQGGYNADNLARGASTGRDIGKEVSGDTQTTTNRPPPGSESPLGGGQQPGSQQPGQQQPGQQQGQQPGSQQPGSQQPGQQQPGQGAGQQQQGSGNGSTTPSQAAAQAVQAANPAGTNHNAVFDGFVAGMAALNAGASVEQAQNIARDTATGTNNVGGVRGVHGSDLDGEAAAAAVGLKAANPEITNGQALHGAGTVVETQGKGDSTSIANTRGAADEAAARSGQAAFAGVADAARASGASVNITQDINGNSSMNVTGGAYGDATITQRTDGTYDVSRPDGSHETGYSVNNGQGISTANPNNSTQQQISNNCVVGNCGSFLAGTLIDTPDGQIKIENLHSGDEIYSFNEKTKQKEISTVGSIYKHEVDEYLVINNKIKVTSNHEFYTLVNKEVKLNAASELKKGNVLVGENNRNILVTSIKNVKKKVTVYNLIDVSPNNNFYAEGVLVHNSCGDVGNSFDSYSNEISNQVNGSGNGGDGDVSTSVQANGDLVASQQPSDGGQGTDVTGSVDGGVSM